MTDVLLYLHSLFRWAVLFSVLTAIVQACTGLLQRRSFSATDNAVRHWTATFFHVQLIVGILLYTNSPLIKWFWGNFREGTENSDAAFFGLIHALLMLCAIVIVTIGSALTKRKPADRAKFTTMLIWYTAALLIILIAIPWPFSPLAARPYIR